MRLAHDILDLFSRVADGVQSEDDERRLVALLKTDAAAREAFQRVATSIRGLPGSAARSGSSTMSQSPTIQSSSASAAAAIGSSPRASRRAASFQTPACLTQVAENRPFRGRPVGGITSTVPSSIATSSARNRNCVS